MEEDRGTASDSASTARQAWPPRVRTFLKSCATIIRRRNSRASRPEAQPDEHLRRFLGARAALSSQRCEERCTPCAHGQQRAKQDDRVDAFAPLRRPMIVLQIQPQRELIQRESRAYSVEDGNEPAREK